MDASFLLRKKLKKYINRPYHRLPIKRRAVFILCVAGFTYREIVALGIATHRTISKALKQAQEENYIGV